MGACREFEGDLAASLYGDLADRAALDRHLAACAACRKEQAELGRMVELLRPVPLKLTPRERVLRKPASWTWLAAGAAVAAALLLAFLLRPAPPAPAPVVVRPAPAPAPKPPVELPPLERPKDMPLPPPPPIAPVPVPVPVPVPAPAPAPVPVPVPDPVPAPAPRPTIVAIAKLDGKDVFPGDVVSTRGELVYGDGTRVAIGPDASVREESGPDGLRLSLLRGELLAHVAKQPAGKPFRMVSGESTAIVLGTVLRLARRGDVTRLEVHEGRVKLDQVEVPAGRFVESTSGTLRPARTTLGLISLYTFSEGAGRRVHDRAGSLDLNVEGRVTWSPDGLRVAGTPFISSEGPATPLLEACRKSNALTIEAWITPERAALDFEGAIVGFSDDAKRRNFALLQGPGIFRVTTRTDDQTELESPKLVAPRLTHVVFTRSAAGVEAIYVDGVRRTSRTRPGSFAAWDATYRLELGDERTQERPWRGTYRLVAIYARALGSAEVIRNFNVGADGW
ncbi:MAG TPA: LamG-like jellyroll fold domain-containing protein [Planctomycetota bacterium]